MVEEDDDVSSLTARLPGESVTELLLVLPGGALAIFAASWFCDDDDDDEGDGTRGEEVVVVVVVVVVDGSFGVSVWTTALDGCCGLLLSSAFTTKFDSPPVATTVSTLTRFVSGSESPFSTTAVGLLEDSSKIFELMAAEDCVGSRGVSSCLMLQTAFMFVSFCLTSGVSKERYR